ncbi:MAG: HK97 family phage prohead protease [Xanthobacteraceae bacterium]|nr:HK97 family phage prohead protease [Xanthobacteraceae bacterium]
MLHGHAIAPLEIRRAADGGAILRGRFPYEQPAVLSDGGRTGRPQKEVIAPRAFAYRVDDPAEDIHLLVGHSFDAPLASKATGTLSFKDTDQALTFNARITPEIAATSYGRDILAMIASGLAVGISPGFRIPPKRAVPVAEKIEEEPDDGRLDDDGNPRRGAIIRTILQALLYELSVVTRPAYDKAQVEMRNWQPSAERVFAPHRPPAFIYNRWRL